MTAGFLNFNHISPKFSEQAPSNSNCSAFAVLNDCETLKSSVHESSISLQRFEDGPALDFVGPGKYLKHLGVPHQHLAGISFDVSGSTE